MSDEDKKQPARRLNREEKKREEEKKAREVKQSLEDAEPTPFTPIISRGSPRTRGSRGARGSRRPVRERSSRSVIPDQKNERQRKLEAKKRAEEEKKRAEEEKKRAEEEKKRSGGYDYSDIDSLTFFPGTHPAVMKDLVEKEDWELNINVKRKKFKNTKHRILYFIWRNFGWRPFEYSNYKRI